MHKKIHFTKKRKYRKNELPLHHKKKIHKTFPSDVNYSMTLREPKPTTRLKPEEEEGK